jgi:hypothetical protein
MMDARDAVLRVLHDHDEQLHWTRVQDLALRQGYLDPFEHPDVRRQIQTALRQLAREGAISRVGKGVYRGRAQLEEEA